MQFIYLFINIHLLNNFIALYTAKKEKKNDFMLIMNIYILIIYIIYLIEKYYICKFNFLIMNNTLK